MLNFNKGQRENFKQYLRENFYTCVDLCVACNDHNYSLRKYAYRYNEGESLNNLFPTIEEFAEACHNGEYDYMHYFVCPEYDVKLVTESENVVRELFDNEIDTIVDELIENIDINSKEIQKVINDHQNKLLTKVLNGKEI